MADFLFHIFPKKILLTCVCISMATKNVIQDILLDRLPAITICFIISSQEQELCWRMIQKALHRTIRFAVVRDL